MNGVEVSMGRKCKLRDFVNTGASRVEQIPGARSRCDHFFFFGGTKYLWAIGMGFVSCHPFST